jgi:hypothetical protein
MKQSKAGKLLKELGWKRNGGGYYAGTTFVHYDKGDLRIALRVVDGKIKPNHIVKELKRVSDYEAKNSK